MSTPGGVSDPDLQGLFASLRSTSGGKNFASSKDSKIHSSSLPGTSSSAQPLEPSTENRQPATMSPSAVPFNLSSSRSATPVAAGDRSNVDRTSTLLSLLKFSTPAPSSPVHSQQHSVATGVTPSTHSVHGRGISASDLVASSMGKPAKLTPRENITAPSSSNHQDFLLKLLNRSNPSQSAVLEQDVAESSEPRDGQQDPPERSITTKPSSPACDEEGNGNSTGNHSPIRVFGRGDDGEPTPFEAPDLAKAQSVPKNEQIFTYVNPFEQLAASAPHTSKPISVNGDGNKRKIIEPSQNSIDSSPRKKATSAGDITHTLEAGVKDIRPGTDVGLGTGRPSSVAETVTVNPTDSQVDEEVKTAISKAEEHESNLLVKQEEDAHAEEAAVNAPSQVELDVNVHGLTLESDHENANDIAGENISRTLTGREIKEVAQGDGVDDWDSADEKTLTTDVERVCHVLLFPMRPFIAIDMQALDNFPSLTCPEAAMTNIARLKKEFDPIDRTLATGTNEFIVYGSPRSGGLRVIRQEDGDAKHLFPETHDRISNISISTANAASAFYGFQNIIATGISGTVYWAPILKPETEASRGSLDDQCLIFPTGYLGQSDYTPNSQVKTRAKKSSRNPEFFAIGRGKSIHIVFPSHARESQFLSDQSIMNTDNYLKDRSLKITTKRAVRDFAFSEDDTTLLTLDKAGKLEFWDVRDLVDMAHASSSILAPAEAIGPIISYPTARPNEKPWPTSVQLVDKPRAYTKGIAQRYVIVGMKQNHTIQLWDLCLGKAVQEMNFPHGTDNDGICSVSYHAATGMVVVGHPTRNSIFLLHLSAPRYNLPPMSQVKFVQRLANKDPTLPKPEATAIISGMREYSFANKGQIRSVELVSTPIEPNRFPDDQARGNDYNRDPVLFELYIMHSKGVASLAIHKEELGWSRDNKVMQPINAEKEGFIVVRELKDSQLNHQSGPPSTNGDAVETSITTSNVIAEDPIATSATPPTESNTWPEDPVALLAVVAEKPDVAGAPSPAPTVSDVIANVAPQGTLKTSQSASSTEEQVRDPTIPVIASPDVPERMSSWTDDRSKRSSGSGESTHPSGIESDPIRPGISSEILEKELKKVESGVSEALNKVFSVQLSTLYQRFNEDRRVQDAASSAKQDAILRLVSSTLGDNVEKSLSRIILSNIHQIVLPAISETTSSVLDKRISEVIAQQLHHAVPPLLKLALPEAISRGVQNPEVLRTIAEQLTGRLSAHIEKEFTANLHNAIIPTFKTFAINVAQRSGVDTENRVHEHLRRAESQHREDSAKIEQLTSLVRGLSETVHMMASAQSEFQQKILKWQQQTSKDRQGGPDGVLPSHGNAQPSPSDGTLAVIKSPEQEELEVITDLMSDGQYEEGTIRWIQSSQQAAIFDNFLIGYNPVYLQQLPHLVVLSVGAAVTSSLSTNIMERLAWLETVFATIDPRDPEFSGVAGRIIDVLSQRLESEYMRIAEEQPHDNAQALRKIALLTRQAKELRSFSR